MSLTIILDFITGHKICLLARQDCTNKNTFLSKMQQYKLLKYEKLFEQYLLMYRNVSFLHCFIWNSLTDPL